jgi:hypothetical protein
MYQQPSNTAARPNFRAAAEIDAGLRAYMTRVYAWMGAGVAFTAAVSALIAINPMMMSLAVGWPKWLAFAGVLGLGWFAPQIIAARSMGAAQTAFWVYAALWGFLITPMVALYAQTIGPMIIVRALLIATSVFAGASLFGYLTRRSLSGLSTFFVMAAIGLLVAMLVNAFLVQSDLMALLVSSAVVLLFAGVAAWETQEIKQLYLAGDDADTGSRKAILGAFMLYGTFITLFIHILRILGLLSSQE